MIDGTKEFRRRGSEPAPAAAPTAIPSAPAEPAAAKDAPSTDLGAITPARSSPEMAEEIAFESSPPEAPDAVNLERRAWFASLVPSMGDGLVKLLRASNNLQRDIHEAMKEGSEAIAESERRRMRAEKERKLDS